MGFYETLEQNIAKIGGKDEAYKLKLKENIRGALGYSNYKSQLGSAIKKPLDLSLMKGNITPQGVKQLVGGAMDIKNQNMDTYQTMVSKVDQAAEQLAMQQIADEKARAAASAEKNEGLWEPKDWLDQQLYRFQLDKPKNEDGTDMTIEQFKEQLFGKVMGEGDAAETLFQSGLTEEMINQRIAQRFPADYEKRKTWYQARLAGATKTEAQDMQDYDNYVHNRMTEGQKSTYEFLNETRVNKANELGDHKTVLLEVDQKVNGRYLTFRELMDNHPGINENVAKEALQDKMQVRLNEDVEEHMNRIVDKKSMLEDYRELYMKGADEKIGLDAVADDADFKATKSRLEAIYQGMFSGDEIQARLKQYVLFNLEM